MVLSETSFFDRPEKNTGHDSHEDREDGHPANNHKQFLQKLFHSIHPSFKG